MTTDRQFEESGDPGGEETNGRSRRAFLQFAATMLGSTWLTLEWSEVASAADHIHKGAQAADDSDASFLTASEMADVDAIASQIIPSDATPGAHEAGIVLFIDRALATFLSRMAPTFRRQLSEFRAACRARNPAIPSFAALSSAEQIAFLKTIEHTAFFDSMRLLTTLGMFAMPAYGGNRDGLGWKLLGFEDRHVFAPPFGYYDRDYPGFVIESKPA